jgi:hypothetical protein
MNRNAVEAIATTFTGDAVNHNIQVTLPGAVVEFLLRWADVGLTEQASPATAAWLSVVRDEVDAQVIAAVSLPVGTLRHRAEEHRTTPSSDGSVSCTCGVTSPRFGTQRLMRQWISDHKRGPRR